MTRKGKGTKIMVLASGQGIPLGVELAAANRYEGDLALQTLDNVSVKRPRNGRPCPERIIADSGGYDYGDELDILASKGINKNLSVGAKYSVYNADRNPLNIARNGAIAADVSKLWVWVEFKF